MTAPNFSAVRALIFDLDGTLIDSTRQPLRTFHCWRSRNSFISFSPR
jgi:phosphoglycolate phosphatase-like HAD superfamily hydrolase